MLLTAEPIPPALLITFSTTGLTVNFVTLKQNVLKKQRLKQLPTKFYVLGYWDFYPWVVEARWYQQGTMRRIVYEHLLNFYYWYGLLKIVMENLKDIK